MTTTFKSGTDEDLRARTRIFWSLSRLVRSNPVEEFIDEVDSITALLNLISDNNDKLLIECASLEHALVKKMTG